MKKINNSFKEEFTTLPKFISIVQKDLKNKQKSSKMFWISLSILIAVTNIVILVLSSIALKNVLDDYNDHTFTMKAGATASEPSFWGEVAPVAGVSALSILIFILSITISIYQGSMKSKTYLTVANTIQYEGLRYSSKENTLTEKEFKSKITSISNAAIKAKTKKSFKKSIVSILTGGTDE